MPEPGPVPTARFSEDPVSPTSAGSLAAAMPFDVVIGSCNPVALPLTIEFDPPKAIGHAVFTAPYEGAPGCVHGAVLAGAFDIMLTAANVIAAGAGPTVTLSIRYLKPTLIGPALAVRGMGHRAGRPPDPQPGPPHPERRRHRRGVGEFVNMDRSRITAMHRRDGERRSRGRGGRPQIASCRARSVSIL